MAMDEKDRAWMHCAAWAANSYGNLRAWPAPDQRIGKNPEVIVVGHDGPRITLDRLQALVGQLELKYLGLSPKGQWMYRMTREKIAEYRKDSQAEKPKSEEQTCQKRKKGR